MPDDLILPSYDPMVHAPIETRTNQGRREFEGDLFRASYSNLFYEYLKHVQSEGFIKHQKAVAFILDSVISISSSFKDISNLLLHGLIFLCDQAGHFAETYAWSNDLYQLKSERKETIEESLSAVAKRQKSIFSWSLSNGKTVLVSLGKERKSGPPFYFREGNTFPGVKTALEGAEPLRNTLDFVQNTVGRKNKWDAKSMLVIPASQVTIKNKDSINALFIGFLGRDPQITEEYVWANSYIELDHIELALSSLSNLGSAFEAQRQRERARILEGTRQFTNLFVHSFGQCARRVSRAERDLGKFLEDGRYSENSSHIQLEEEFGRDNEISRIREELCDVAQDLRSIKGSVLSPLSDMNWNRTGRVDEAIGQALLNIKRLTEEVSIDIYVSQDYEDTLVVSIDTLLLEKILENLFENAIKAVEENSGKKRVVVSINHDKENSRAIIEVEDNGCGLPEDYESWIWKTKGRSEWSQGSSTGVGLFACRALLKIFGGGINVAPSNNNGMSTTAQLTLRVD